MPGPVMRLLLVVWLALAPSLASAGYLYAGMCYSSREIANRHFCSDAVSTGNSSSGQSVSVHCTSTDFTASTFVLSTYVDGVLHQNSIAYPDYPNCEWSEDSLNPVEWMAYASIILVTGWGLGALRRIFDNDGRSYE